MKLILASDNQGKVAEIRRLLPDLDVKSLRDVGFDKTIPEPFATFHENAKTKARTVHERFGGWVLSDDSGLCVTAMDGAPGVYSARFAGENANDAANNALMLNEMMGIEDRSAWYYAVLCLIAPDGAVHFFDGTCDGSIAHELRGEGGFGYDPLFIPAGHDKTFGELPHEVKAGISHRARALEALLGSGLLQSSSNA